MSSIEPMIFNPTIRRKRTYSQTFIFTDANDVPLDLTGYNICAQIREKEEVGSDLIAEFNIDTTDLATGEVTIYFDESETNAIKASTGFWDMLFEIDTTHESWVEGKVEIRGSVTEVS